MLAACLGQRAFLAHQGILIQNHFLLNSLSLTPHILPLPHACRCLGGYCCNPYLSPACAAPSTCNAGGGCVGGSATCVEGTSTSSMTSYLCNTANGKTCTNPVGPSSSFSSSFPSPPPCMCKSNHYYLSSASGGSSTGNYYGITCLACPANSIAPFGTALSLTGCACPANFFLDTPASGPVCAPCPPGTTSPPGSSYAGCTLGSQLNAQASQLAAAVAAGDASLSAQVAAERAYATTTASTVGGVLGGVILLLSVGLAVALHRRSSGALPLATARKQLEQPVEAPKATHNPVHRPAKHPHSLPAGWERHTEGADVWYEHKASGKTQWEVPT